MKARTGLTALLFIGLLVLGAVLVMRMGSNQKRVEQPAVAAEPAPKAVPPAVNPPMAGLVAQPAPVAGQAPQVHARSEEAPPGGVIAVAPVSKEPPVKVAASVAAAAVEAPTVVVKQVEVVEVPVEMALAESPAIVAASATPPVGDSAGNEIQAAPAGTAGARAPGDLILDRKTRAMGFDPVVFPHWRHRIHFRCYVCHSQVFKMKRGASEITMTTIDQGQFCGKCHNGEVAFNVEFQNCARCHMPSVARTP